MVSIYAHYKNVNKVCFTIIKCLIIGILKVNFKCESYIIFFLYSSIRLLL